MTQGKNKFQPLTSKSVCLIYELLFERGFVSFPLTHFSTDKVDSLVATIVNSYFGFELYPSVEEKAVAYLYFLIKDHAFTDGNKRTACLAFEVVCDLNSLDPIYDGFTLDELAVLIEKSNLEHHQLIKLVTSLLFPTIKL